MANINMGTSPSRASFIRKTEDIGPGQYDDGKRFNSDTKTFTIGEKRVVKEAMTMGPGAYSPERAETITKTRMANVTMGSSPSRATFVQKDSAIGPGHYNEVKQTTKSFIIGEKRPEKIQSSMGPGAYSPERAETITKTRNANVNFGSSPSRQPIHHRTNDVGPGQYDDGKRFGSETKTFTI